MMVPTPWPSAIVALTGAVRLTRKVSFASSSVSPVTEHGERLRRWPGAKVHVRRRTSSCSRPARWPSVGGGGGDRDRLPAGAPRG